MPAFGFNPYADQTESIKSLGASLFPDPSKAALAYHYGTESRKGQLEGNKLIDQGNWRSRYGQMTQGGPQPGPPVWQQMNNVPGAPPILAPDPGLPMAGAAPPAAAPPLGAMIAQAASNTTPQQAVTAIATVAPSLATGPPPPGTPPTGTAGAVLNNDPGADPLRLNTTGGGRQQAPPAAQNGSPAGVPPGMTLPGLMAMHATGALAGIDAQTLAGGGQALAYELFDRGMIDEHRLKIMLGTTGQAGPWQQDIQAAATVKGHQITAGATLEAARLREAELARQFDEGLKVTLGPDGKPIYTRQRSAAGQPAAIDQVEVTKQTQQGAPGQYYIPGTGQTKTMTAGQAVTQGAPAAATSVDQQLAQLRQRIEDPKISPEERARLIAQSRVLAATPRELDPEKQFAQQKIDYRNTQQVYSTPQKGVLDKFGVNEPSAFDFATETAIRQRAFDLSQQPGKDYLRVDPSEARLAAIHDLMKNPTAEGLRLPTPAEVAQQRRATRQRVATFGVHGDPRLDDFTNPNIKGAEPTPHMMIRLVPQDYKPDAGAPAAPAPGAPAPGAPAAPAPGAPAPPLSSVVPAPGSTTAQSPTQMYGGVVPGAPPSPGLGGTIAQGMQVIEQAGRATNPAPMSPAQMYGSQPGAAGAAAPAAPVVSGGAPPGAVGPAPAGWAVGQTGTHNASGRVFTNRGGWLFPAQ